MPCDRKLKPRQTISERAKEIREAMTRLADAIRNNRVKVKMGPQGAFAIEGWDDKSRDGVTDNCAYHRIMASGDHLARMAVQRAEQMAGRPFNKQVIGQGAHSHDGGRTWHNHKG